ncbi:hypothetical protein [Paenibacillus sedimenti]|uniref:Uncharacterized protein n=1 Tax=Paenibacillus sedimenti TaxID=2770274 RepID=A0A926QIP7_9BACL|nr:hypothetical protein [Paenibacillus sedimenti]MBD0379557.1 hypothetical protein [Paenibacillus sedimenti]
MVEYINLQDNSEEIMKCIVNCDTDQAPNTDQAQIKVNEGLFNSIPNDEEYIDEP